MNSGSLVKRRSILLQSTIVELQFNRFTLFDGEDLKFLLSFFKKRYLLAVVRIS